MKNLIGFQILVFSWCLNMHCQAQYFTEVGESAGIIHRQIFTGLMGGGMAIFDYNQDGWEDIYMTGGEAQDKLFLNRGNWVFEEIGDSVGLQITKNKITLGVTTGDIDNDGMREIYVTTIASDNILLKRNDAGQLVDISKSAHVTGSNISTAASFGDYNLDGYLDLYVINYVKSNYPILDEDKNPVGFDPECYPNNFYINNGDGTFQEIANLLGLNDLGCGFAVAFTDFDNDRDLDLYIANDFGEWNIPNRAYKNNYPQNSFSDVSTISSLNAAIYGMGIAVGDYDLDGDLDYYVTNLGRNVLFQNLGNGIFMDVTMAAKVENTYAGELYATGWGTGFFDYNNDSYPDLFISNGEIPTFEFIANAPENPNVLYENKGDNSFEDISQLAGIDDPAKGRGFAYGDLDNDGDLDMVIGNVNRSILNDERFMIYRNNLALENHWIEINLQGQICNKDGIGSLVLAYAGGNVFMREVDGGSSHGSQNSNKIHIGLGSTELIDSLLISWPGGKRNIFRNIPASSILQVQENIASVFVSDTVINKQKVNSLCTSGVSIFKIIGHRKSYFYKLYDATNNIYLDEAIALSSDTLRLNSGYIDLTTSFEIHFTDGDSPYYQKIDTTLVKYSQIEIPEIILSDNKLTATKGKRYQWYYNNQPAYASVQSIEIEKDGIYRVEVTNEYGCRVSSKEFPVYITGVAPERNQLVKIFPNPTEGLLNLQLLDDNHRVYDIAVYDISGRQYLTEIYQQNGSVDLNQVDLRSLKNGIYFISISTAKNIYQFKVDKR